MSALSDDLRTAIAAHAAPEHQPAFTRALDAAEQAAADTEQLDAVVTATLALWDVPIGLAASLLLMAINHLAFGSEQEAAAVLAALQEGAGECAN